MKLKVDIGEPFWKFQTYSVRGFYNSLTPEEKREVKDEQTFQDMFENFMWELLEEYRGKIAPKET